MESRRSPGNSRPDHRGRHSRLPGPVWPGLHSYSGVVWGRRYAPVYGGSAAELSVSERLSIGGPTSSHAPRGRQTAVLEIQEEVYDLSLLGSAAPMGPRYHSIPEEEPAVPMFDVTSALGPMGSHDADFIKTLQVQEAKGAPTGGLDRGFERRSEAVRVWDSDPLSSPATLPPSLDGSLSWRRSLKPPSRAETIREAGQDEAAQRGQIVEVILEEPLAGADISNIEGSNMLYDSKARRPPCSFKEQETQMLCPQPNWKPFSMRWPYLTVLILLSVALAGVQDILYRRYSKDPILRFKSPEDVTPGLYFAVKFAPTLSAVVYGVLWQFTDFEVRRLEAFYQLSKPGGALAAESINVDYITSFTFVRPLRALRLGHYAVALSSAATTLAASLVPTFAAASVMLSPSREERMEKPNADKVLHLSATWSRLLTTTLMMCAVAGCALFYLLQSRRSGLLADVRGIAGLASMAVASHILMDFKDMDTARHKDIHHRLKHNRYILRNSSLAPDNENPVSWKDWDRAHTVTDKAPWLVTVLAVGLKMSWNAMETAVRVMEPFYILSRRQAAAKTLMLDYTALPFGYLPLQALFNGHGLVFAVGFGSVMAEFLTILVTSLATVDGQGFLAATTYHRSGVDSGQETVRSFYVSLALSVFILVYMSMAACVVFCRRRHPFLPRQPNTIASVLAYMHQSKMLCDFVGTARLSKADMARKLDDGKTYGLGWFQGRDGQTHCGVDHEELTSSYKHGVDYTQRNQPWNTQWDAL